MTSSGASRRAVPDRLRAWRDGPLRWPVLVVVALLGAWLALLVGGSTTAEIGPTQAHLRVAPSLTGESVLVVPPLGAIVVDSHDAPLRLRVEVTGVERADVARVVEDPQRLSDIGERVRSDLRAALMDLAVRTLVVAAVGAALAVALVLHRLRRALVGAAAALGVLVASGAAAAFTFTPAALNEPRFRGTLAAAPALIGDVEQVMSRFSAYTEQLGAMVANLSQLYEVVSTLPVYQPEGDVVRVLSVSDIHLNPGAFEVIDTVVDQFKVDVIVDAGDLTDHGVRPENRAMADLVADLDIPYVFVPGNHDARATAETIEDVPGTTVLREPTVVEVAGLHIAGAAGPAAARLGADASDEEIEQAALALAETIRDYERDGPQVDIAVVHDPAMAEPLAGLVPLVLAGHGHEREVRMIGEDTRLFEQGSTGGAGLRTLQGAGATPLQLSVLYVDQSTGELQAWDDIDVAAVGSASVEVERQLVAETEDPAETADAAVTAGVGGVSGGGLAKDPAGRHSAPDGADGPSLSRRTGDVFRPRPTEREHASQ